uniref:Uncharacterized protein n=1 Tax=Timema monikensis TaxID=170555 RepID=A0A7R9HMA1_9NEOP|nr:unnamed protein product [Timema monikensis]
MDTTLDHRPERGTRLYSLDTTLDHRPERGTRLYSLDTALDHGVHEFMEAVNVTRSTPQRGLLALLVMATPLNKVFRAMNSTFELFNTKTDILNTSNQNAGSEFVSSWRDLLKQRTRGVILAEKEQCGGHKGFIGPDLKKAGLSRVRGSVNTKSGRSGMRKVVNVIHLPVDLTAVFARYRVKF